MAWNVKDWLEEQKREEELKKQNANKQISREEAVKKIKADAAKPASMPKSASGNAVVYTPLPVHSKTTKEQAAVRQSAETQPKSTRSEFYSQPTDIGSHTKELQKRLENNRKKINSYKTRLGTIRQIYQVTGDKKYAEKYEREYKEYYNFTKKYDADVNAFNTYTAGEQKRYTDWESTVRKPELIRPEIEAYTRKINELEELRGNINKLLLGQGADLPEIAEQRRGRIQEINAQIEQMKAKRDKLSEELLYSNQFYYEGIRNSAENFEEQSKPGNVDKYDNRHLKINITNRESDPRYKGANELVAGHYARMTNEERDMYNYLYNTHGKEAADKFMDDMELEAALRAREGHEMYEEYDKKSGFGRALRGAQLAVASGVNQFARGTANLFTEDALESAPVQYAAGEAIENSSGIGRVALELTQTMANMAPSILLSTAAGNLLGVLGASAKVAGTVGRVTGAASMGGSAAGNAYAEKVKAGYDPDEARTYAALVGASEASLEYLLGGISKLGGTISGKVLAKNIEAIDNGFLRFAAKFGKAGASEAIEENLQAFLEPAFASWVFNEKYDAPELEDLVYTTIVSALSGGMFESGEIVRSELNRAAEQSQKNTAESGGDSSPDKGSLGDAAIAKDVEAGYNNSINESEVDGNEHRERGLHIRQVEERADASYTQESGEGISRRARGDGAWRKAQAERAADTGNSCKALGRRRLSSKELGMRDGTNKKTSYIVPDELLTEREKRYRAEQAERGVEVTYYSGAAEVIEDGKKVGGIRGEVSSDGKRMWIQVDDPDVTSEMIEKHEDFHRKAKADKGLVASIRDEILKGHSKEELRGLAAAYAEEYGWLDEDADYIFEEIFADAYAGIDIFEYMESFEGATRFSPETESVTNNAGDYYSSGTTPQSGTSGTPSPTRESFGRAQRPAPTDVGSYRGEGNESGRVSDDDVPDYYDDGDIAYMDIGNKLLILEMQPNGEFSVIDIKENTKNDSMAMDKGTVERYSTKEELSEERRGDSDRDGSGFGKPGRDVNGSTEDTGRDNGRESCSKSTATDNQEKQDGVKHSRATGYSHKREVEDLQRQLKEVVRQNEKLKGETKRTGQTRVRLGDCRRLAGKLARQYNISLDETQLEELTLALQGVGNMIVSGGELNYNVLKNKLLKLSRKLVDNAVVCNNQAWEEYKDMRDYFREKELIISAEDAKSITDFNDFRRRNFGRMPHLRIAKPGERGNIDSDFREMCDLWPEFFNEGEVTHPADILMTIADALESIQAVYENPYSANKAMAAEYIANDMLDNLLSAEIRQSAPTFADRQARKHAKEMARVKSLSRERANKMLEREREKSRKKEAEYADRYRKRAEKELKSQSHRDLLKSVIRRTARLERLLMRPTKTKHIVEELRGIVATALKAINLESLRQMTIDADTGRVRVARDKDELLFPTEATKHFREMQEKYADIIANHAGALVADEEIISKIRAVEELAGIKVREMTDSQLRTVYDMLVAVETSVRDANTLFTEGRFKTVSELGNRLIADNEGHRDGVKGLISQKLMAAELESMTPETFFHGLGPAGDAIYRMLRSAENKQVGILGRIYERSGEICKDLDVKKLEKKLLTIELRGEEYKISVAQLLELYNLNKRGQARKHIKGGGLQLSKNKEYVEGTEVIRRVSKAELNEALRLLDGNEEYKKAKRAADEMMEFLDELADYGNEATLAAYGYKIFGAENYWPIKSVESERAKEEAAKGGTRLIASKPFSKPTEDAISAPLLVGSIFDTFANYCSEMAQYSAWLTTEQDINRIRRFKSEDTETKDGKSIESVIEKVYGKAGVKYWDKLMSDLSMGIKNDEGFWGAALKSVMGLNMATAIAGNIRVVVQQPTAIVRAMSEINPIYFTNAHMIEGAKKAEKYSPLAVWKGWGHFEANIGKSNRDMMFGTEGVSDKISDTLMTPVAQADRMAWGLLWNACEAETKAKRKELSPGSDAFYDAVAARFEGIIEKTQVVDSVLQRSQAMRRKDYLSKTLTAFMSEPTKELNMMLRAVRDVRHAPTPELKKAAQKQLARSCVSMLVSTTLNAAVVSFVDAARDDDDRERKYWERWIKHFAGINGDGKGWLGKTAEVITSNAGDAINPFNRIPLVKDIQSMIKGFTVSNMGFDYIEDTIKSAEAVIKSFSGSGTLTPWNAIIGLAGAVAKVFKIPVDNILRDAIGITRSIAQETGNYVLMYRIDKLQYSPKHERNGKIFLDTLYKAYTNDREAYEVIYNDLVKSGMATKKIRGGMQDRQKDAEGVTKVEDMKAQRYLEPELERAFNSRLSSVKKSKAYKAADKDDIDMLEDTIYQLVTRTGNYEEWVRVIEGGSKIGLTEEEWLEYKLGLKVKDEKNSNDEYGGTPTNKEKNASLEMMSGLSSKEKAYLKNPSKFLKD